MLLGLAHTVGLGGQPGPPADRHQHTDLARSVTAQPNLNQPSVLDLITAREAAATEAAHQLREQIAALAQQLAAVETELSELAITRTTLLRLTSGTEPAPAADATLARPAYQQILAVFTTAGTPLRAKDICHALGIGSTANDTESLRAKLKRLVARHVLLEPEPGLFALAPTARPTEDPRARPLSQDQT